MSPERYIAGIALGSNLGDRQRNLSEALLALEAKGYRIIKASRFYETKPEQFESNELFLNQVVIAEAEKSPGEILRDLMAIEAGAGRVRTEGCISDRTLDLDLLFADDIIMDTVELVLPHPRMHLRKFVLEPLCEIMPEWIHPKLKRTATSLLNMMNNKEVGNNSSGH